MRTLVLALLAIVLAGGALAACSTPQQQNSPLATPTATATATPAVAPIPTATPSSTTTPTPTATATTIPTPRVWPTSTPNPTPTPIPTIPIVQSALEMVPPIVGPTHVNWVKIGEARNGDEVLALPIPWDRMIRDLADADLRIVAWLDQLNRPDGAGPETGTVFGYLITDNSVVVYGRGDHDGPGISYYRVEVPLSELKGLSP
jgi:hypothetical protein